MTKQKQLILQIVKDSDRHLTAAQVYDEAKKVMPKTVMATVYNNLNGLVSENLIRRVKISGQPDHYDRLVTPHEHLICEKCEKISDITLGDLKRQFSKKSGVTVNSYELNLYYVCPECLKKGIKR